MSAACVGLGVDGADQPLGSAGRRVPGWDLRVLRDDGSPAEPGELGTIVSKLPLPPAAFDTLYNLGATTKITTARDSAYKAISNVRTLGQLHELYWQCIYLLHTTQPRLRPKALLIGSISKRLNCTVQ